MPQLRENLKRIRKLRGMTLEELEARVGSRIPRMIETGQTVGSVQMLSAIAAVLGVTVDELIADLDPPLPESLKRFLESPAGSDVTHEERAELARLAARGREPPSELTYQMYLMTLRTMSKKGGA